MTQPAPSHRTVFGFVLLAASVITLPALSGFMKHTIDATTLIVRFVIAVAVCGIAARIMIAFLRSMSAHARVVASDKDEAAAVLGGAPVGGLDRSGPAAAEAAATADPLPPEGPGAGPALP